MTITIDQSKCIGCSNCVTLCPMLFQMTDEGKSKPIQEDVSDTACAENAIKACPTAAIQYVQVRK